MAKRWGARAYIESSSLLNINVKYGKISYYSQKIFWLNRFD